MGRLAVVDLPYPHDITPGHPSPDNAATLLEGLRIAAAGCLDGRYAAMVTAPVAKNVIAASGVPFTGHTEFLAEVTGGAFPVMMLVAGDLRVAVATTHLPLRDVAGALDATTIERVARTLYADLQTKFGIDHPEIVVCGLNPHAGEGGLLGTEELDYIAPLLERLRDEGLNLRGPLPADTAFTPAAGPKDAVLAMYHDQGLPVLKYAGFGHSVNVTLGLPFVRTSPDHGTAFALAKTPGQADPSSMLEALRLARTLTHNRFDTESRDV